jgi:RimJ/RimL family protein N-acetyltransferase
LADSAAAAFWAERLGCAQSAFESPGLTVVAHPLPGRLYAMCVGEAVVVAAPESLRERVRAVARPAALVTPEGLRPLLPEGALLVGPARIAYLHRPLAAPEGVARIDSVADARLARLRARVTAEEWQHANLDAAEVPIFACLEAGEVAAAAGFERVGGRVAHIGVLSDPRLRGRGLGRRAVQAAAAHAFAAGLMTQYQTLASNTPALRIADSLGFELFAVTLAARL